MITADQLTAIQERADAATEARLTCVNDGLDSMPLSYYALAETSSYDVPDLLSDNAKHRAVIEALAGHHRETTAEHPRASGKSFTRHECIECGTEWPCFTTRAIAEVLTTSPASADQEGQLA